MAGRIPPVVETVVSVLNKLRDYDADIEKMRRANQKAQSAADFLSQFGVPYFQQLVKFTISDYPRTRNRVPGPPKRAQLLNSFSFNGQKYEG